MANKKSSKKKTNKTKINYKSWIFTIVSILLIILTYKCILISIANRKGDIDTFIKERKVTGYASEIKITHEEKNNYINFEGIRIENVFNNLNREENRDKYPALIYTNKETGEGISIYKEPTIINNFETQNIEKYMNAANIKNDDDIYDLVINYKRTKLDIFDSFKSIRQEMFKGRFFIIAYHTIDEIHKITGDLNGRVYLWDDNITYEIYNKDNMYVITFYKGYDIDSTIDIISSISFQDNIDKSYERGYYITNENDKEYLVISSGEKPNGCYDIKVNDIEYINDTLKVIVEETYNESTCTMALTYPKVKVEITKEYQNIEVLSTKNAKFNKIS